MTPLAFLLCVSIIAVAASSAVSIYFVCRLVDRVTKLNAAPDIVQWERMMKIEQKPKSVDGAPQVLGGETAGDGTLTDEALAELSKTI